MTRNIPAFFKKEKKGKIPFFINIWTDNIAWKQIETLSKSITRKKGGERVLNILVIRILKLFVST